MQTVKSYSSGPMKLSKKREIDENVTEIWKSRLYFVFNSLKSDERD